MKKKAVSATMLTLLLIGMLSISMHIVLVKAQLSFIDIRILSVTASPTTVYVGEIVNIAVTYEITWMNIDVEQWPGFYLYYDGVWIDGWMMIVMGSGYDIETVYFEWDTTDVEPGSYMISAEVYGDDDPSGNWFFFGPIRVKIPGDVNGDGTVDILDAAEISAHWYPGPPVGPLGYDPNADINNDGNVDIIDLAIVSAHWGQTE